MGDEEVTALKPYPAYRQTGLPWLGQIPAHWNVKRAKWLFSDSIEKNHSDETLLSVTQGQGVVARADAEMRVWNPGEDISGYKLVVPNEFVISLRSFEGGIEISYVRGIVSPAYVVLCPQHPEYNDYFRHLFKSRDFVSNLSISTRGIRQGKNITYWDFRELPLPIPPIEEQDAIVAHLNQRTVKIDALISKKQRLLELLAEQRAALISQAVTKGLNPDVKMKDSGVAWLGQVPEHWEVKRLKWTIEYCQNGAWGDEPNGIDDVACVRVADFDRVRFRINFPVPTFRALPEAERRKKSLRKGDLLLEKSGGGDLQPVGFIVLYDSDEPAICSNFVARMPAGENYDPNFLCYLHASLYAAKINTQSIKQNTGIQNLDSAAYLNEKVCIPPFPEQQVLAAVLDQQTERLTQLAAKVETAIERLREYRPALISSAVTGKIMIKDEEPIRKVGG